MGFSKIRPIALLMTSGFCCLPHSAYAGFNFQTYQNRNSPSFILLDSVRGDDSISSNPFLNSFIYQYFYNPIDFDQGEDGQGTLVSNIQSVNFASEYTGWKNISLGLEMPLHQLKYHQQGDRFAFGDMRLFSKIKLLHEESNRIGGLSFVPSVYVPTGNDDLLVSNSNGGVGGNLVYQKKVGSFFGALNLGTDYFPKASYRNVNYDMQAYAGFGAKYDLSERWSAQVEWLGRQIREVRIGDLYSGGQYRFSPERTLYFGGSLASSYLSGPNFEYRLMLGFRWSPASNKIITQQIHTKIETIQKMKTLHDCGPKIYTKNFTARALSRDEKKYFSQDQLLPYISTPKHPIDTLNLGGKSGLTQELVPYVKDAQVVFALDIAGLPPKDRVISVKAIDLYLKINKLSTPDEENTDMICLLNEKVCSGDLYRRKTMAENINSKFFMGKEPPNDFFMRQVFSSERIMTPTRDIFTTKLKLPLTRLLENSVVPDTLRIIYSNTIYFAVAHDVYVHKPIRLNIELSAEACTETHMAPTVETHIEQKKTELNEVPNDKN